HDATEVGSGFEGALVAIAVGVDRRVGERRLLVRLFIRLRAPPPDAPPRVVFLWVIPKRTRLASVDHSSSSSYSTRGLRFERTPARLQLFGILGRWSLLAVPVFWYRW